MRRTLASKVTYFALGTLLFVSGWAVGQERGATEKTALHVVAFTTPDGMTQQDWDAFKQATATLVTTMPGLKRAWAGKLRQPVVMGDVTRTHGLVLEFDSLKSRLAYSSHPTREPWAKTWEKVRKTGTIVDVIGE